MNTTNGMHDCLHATNNVRYTTIKALIFMLASANYVWVVKPTQVRKVIA